jgi:arylsulfatase A-like enzyme
MADAPEDRPDPAPPVPATTAPPRDPEPPRVRAPSIPPPTEPVVLRLGEATLAGLAAALITSLPVAMRVAGEGGSPLGGLVASAAVLTAPFAVIVFASRAAGRAFRMVTGRGAGRSTAVGLAMWAGLSAPLLLALAAALKAGTNHRGLGGATFGALALVIVLVTALGARRLVTLGHDLAGRGVAAPAAIERVASGGALLLAAGATFVGLRGSDGGEAASRVVAALVDGALAFVATILAGGLVAAPTVRRVAGRVGLPFGVAVVALGLVWIERSRDLSRAVQARGGLGPAVLGALEGWTDRDGDGAGARFGGHDCDDGDPRRHASAADVAGDALDADCDGRDAARGPSADAVVAVAEPSAPPPPGDEPAADRPATAGAPPDPAAPHDTPASLRTTTPAGPPSIVLVTLDTVRADRTSAYGYAKETTPALEALAARGVLFEHAYAVASDTQRALTPLVSGRRLSRTARDSREWPTIRDSVDTIAERVRRAGYATAAVTSFTWLSRDRGFDQGFDEFEAVYEKDHPERGITGPHALAAARAILARRDDDPRPLFLWVHLFDAHERYLPHPGHDFGGDGSGLYDGEIAFVDRQLAGLVEAVAASKRAATTAFVVHGSHGEGWGEHGVEGHGADLWEPQIHVPFVIALPGVKPGRYARGAVSTAHIPATILELAGAPADGIEGRSLAAIARGALDTPGEPVFARSRRRAVVVDWPLKLLVHVRKGKDRHILFDLSADPAEEKDLSADRHDDLVRLIAAHERFEEGPAEDEAGGGDGGSTP